MISRAFFYFITYITEGFYSPKSLTPVQLLIHPSSHMFLERTGLTATVGCLHTWLCLPKGKTLQFPSIALQLPQCSSPYAPAFDVVFKFKK